MYVFTKTVYIWFFITFLVPVIQGLFSLGLDGIVRQMSIIFITLLLFTIVFLMYNYIYILMSVGLSNFFSK